MQTDVLIVGAGPTGLMLANQLARRGVRFMIIDRHSGPAQQTRAMAVRKDGSQFHVEVHGAGFLYKGQPHILSVIRDVSERMAAKGWPGG